MTTMTLVAIRRLVPFRASIRAPVVLTVLWFLASHAQACLLEMWTFDSMDDCVAVSENAGEPAARGLIEADGTCRTTEVLESGLIGSPESDENFLGRYSAICRPDEGAFGSLAVWESGCEEDDCGGGTAPGTTCYRGLPSTASLFSGGEPPGVHTVQDPSLRETGFFDCYIVYGGGSDQNLSMTYAFFGDCTCGEDTQAGTTAAPVASPEQTTTESPTTAPTATPTIAPAATPTISPTATPTIAPTATPTISPTQTSGAAAPPTEATTESPTGDQQATPSPTTVDTDGTDSSPSDGDGSGGDPDGPGGPDNSPSDSDGTDDSPSDGGSGGDPDTANNDEDPDGPDNSPSDPDGTDGLDPGDPPSDGANDGDSGETSNSPPGLDDIDSSSSSSSTIPIVAGASSAALVVLLLVAGILFCFFARRRQKGSTTLKDEPAPQSNARSDKRQIPYPESPQAGKLYSEIVCPENDEVSTLGVPLGVDPGDYSKSDETTTAVPMTQIRYLLNQGSGNTSDTESDTDKIPHDDTQDETEQDDDDQDDTDQNPRGGTSRSVPPSSNVMSYEVNVPPGRLGMAMQASEGIPIVHDIKPDSVFATHDVQVGDRLVAVDDVDVRDMAAGDVSELITRKADQSNRLFTFERPTSSGENTA